MGRQKLVKYSDGVYHVSARCNNKEGYPLPLSDCWHIYGYHLQKLKQNFNVKIYAFTLMSNHFHLLCSTPDCNLDKAMQYFMTMTSKGIGFASGKINHLYGGRYHWNYTNNPESFLVLYKYILRNPIRANLCRDPRDYPWCTIPTNFYKFSLDRSEFHDFLPTEDYYNWLCDGGEIKEDIITQSLKKKEFGNILNRTSRRTVQLESYLAAAKPKGARHL